MITAWLGLSLGRNARKSIELSGHGSMLRWRRPWEDPGGQDCLHVSDALRIGQGRRLPMSASSARKYAGKDVGDGPNSGKGSRARSVPTVGAIVEGKLGPIPPALPSDPGLRAELIARLERGLAEVRAGRDVSWEDLDRRTRAKHGLPPA